MTFRFHTQPIVWPVLAWLTVALAGFAAPTASMLIIAAEPSQAPLVMSGGPILALGLMAAGMIAAAVTGRLWIGVVLALLNVAYLIVLALALGMPSLPHPVSTGLAFLIASVSFAVRGALFARSGEDKGWLIAVFVVAGEAAILLTALAKPDALPEWLLVLLPAQWASMAIQNSLTGTGAFGAWAALIALAGTALATQLVAKLWPRRWPYLVMFTTWLSLSALVWFSTNSQSPRIDQDVATSTTDQTMPPANTPSNNSQKAKWQLGDKFAEIIKRPIEPL